MCERAVDSESSLFLIGRIVHRCLSLLPEGEGQEGGDGDFAVEISLHDFSLTSLRLLCFSLDSAVTVRNVFQSAIMVSALVLLGLLSAASALHLRSQGEQSATTRNFHFHVTARLLHLFSYLRLCPCKRKKKVIDLICLTNIGQYDFSDELHFRSWMSRVRRVALLS